jgi:hypothetical protein
MEFGMHVWSGGYGTTVDTARVWHTAFAAIAGLWSDYDGAYYDVSAHKIKNATIRGDVSKISDQSVTGLTSINPNRAAPFGIWWNQGQYTNNLHVDDTDVQGMAIGLFGPVVRLRMNNTFFRNYHNIATWLGQSRFPRQYEIRTTTFQSLPNLTLPSQSQQDVYLVVKPEIAHHDTLNTPTMFELFTKPTIIKIYGYNSNGVNHGDLRVYFLEQAANFNIKQVHSLLQNDARFPSMTNTQSKAQYGNTIADEIAPCSTTLPKIRGFACPINNPVVHAFNDNPPLANGVNYWVAKGELPWIAYATEHSKTANLVTGLNFLTVTHNDVPVSAVDANNNGVVDANEQFKKTFIIER